jgi:hypothetical protein
MSFARQNNFGPVCTLYVRYGGGVLPYVRCTGTVRVVLVHHDVEANCGGENAPDKGEKTTMAARPPEQAPEGAAARRDSFPLANNNGDNHNQHQEKCWFNSDNTVVTDASTVKQSNVTEGRRREVREKRKPALRAVRGEARVFRGDAFLTQPTQTAGTQHSFHLHFCISSFVCVCVCVYLYS